MRRLTLPLAVAAALPLLTTACDGSAAPSSAPPPSASKPATAKNASDGVQQITIDTTDNFRFVPENVQAHAGKLRILLTDRGSYPHNISFPTLHATSKTVSGNPGQQTTTFTIDLTRKGNYDFVCTFHSSAGMKGRVTVS